MIFDNLINIFANRAKIYALLQVLLNIFKEFTWTQKNLHAYKKTFNFF